MTYTSGERREVAARLRAYPLESVKAGHKGKDPLQLPADVMYDLMDIAGVGEDFDSLLPALADLIDSTCEIVTDQVDDGEWGAHEFYECCSNCGNQNMRDRFTGKPHRYCPNCGARVVDE